MLSHISWFPFLVFLSVVVAVYYVVVLFGRYAPVLREKVKRRPGAVVPKPNPEPVAVTRLEDIPPTSLLKDLRSWLIQSHQYDLTSLDLLQGIETRLNAHPEERKKMNKETFTVFLTKMLRDTGFFSVTPVEIEHLWDATGAAPSFSFF